MSSFEPFAGWDRRKAFAASGTTATDFRTEREPAVIGSAPHASTVADASPDPNRETSAEPTFADGLEAGRREAASREHERAVTALDTAARTLLDLRDGYLASNRREIVDLALAVAAAVLGRPLRDDADALARRLAGAFDSIPSGGPLTLSLSPPDHALIEAESTSELSRELQGRAVETRVDPTLKPGEFSLEAGLAEVDARHRTLLADLRERLIEAAGGGDQ